MEALCMLPFGLLILFQTLTQDMDDKTRGTCGIIFVATGLIVFCVALAAIVSAMHTTQ